jgi:hypothetical protein
VSSTRRPFLPPGPDARALRIGFVGLVIAVCGALLGVTGWATSLRPLWFVGYVIGLVGCAVGFIGILYGWVTGGGRAITEGFSGTWRVLVHFWSRVLRRQ